MYEGVFAWKYKPPSPGPSIIMVGDYDLADHVTLRFQPRDSQIDPFELVVDFLSQECGEAILVDTTVPGHSAFNFSRIHDLL